MEKENSRKKALLAASVAGLLAVSGFMANAATLYAEVECHGVNACKGMGDCGGKDHGCAGKNACKGQGYVSLPSEEVCKKVGGTLTAAV